MRRALKIAGTIVVLGIAACTALLGISALFYMREMRIDRTRGVEESGYIRIGGIDQWIQIRGDSRANPILLWLNGGPGFSTISTTPLFRSWEKEFTVVMWDQRGEGRTFQRAGPEGNGPMTIERMTEDGIELAQYLRAHLGKDKLIVLGHSWGSILGVRMVKQRPDLFAAYVGTGQVTSMPADVAASYPLLLARVHAAGNRAAETQLAAIGAPPYADPQRSLTWTIWANQFDPGRIKLPFTAWLPWAIVESSLAQRSERAGLQFSQRRLFRQIMQVDVLSLGDVFEVPVVMIQGSEDIVTVTALVRAYFDRISAPHKDFVLIPGDGHLALLKVRDNFLSAVTAHLRLVLVRSASPVGET